jgi:hypothetical protein
MAELRMLRRSLCSLLLGVMMVSLTGCATAARKAHDQREVALSNTLDSYRKLIRWGSFEEASRYLKAREGEAKVEMPVLARYKPWKVAHYNEVEVLRNGPGDEALVTVDIQFYSEETGMASSVRDKQRWWYESGAAGWHLASPMPDFDAATRFKK